MKITVAKTEKEYNEVVIRKGTVEDIIRANQLAGSEATESENTAALLSIIATFDGKQIPYEEVKRLPFSDFLELQEAITSKGLLMSPKQLSSLSKMAGLPKAK
ncbi:MAG: phage tail assembly protein [Bacteroidales bacterium]|nr:phage tail assembly protein [Bacteroidales bacterium]